MNNTAMLVQNNAGNVLGKQHNIAAQQAMLRTTNGSGLGLQYK
jgi:hypothetical protein